MCTHTYTHTYTCMHKHIQTYLHTYTVTQKHTCTQIHIHAHKYIHTSTHTHAHIPTNIHVHARCTHTRAHTHTCIHTLRSKQVCNDNYKTRNSGIMEKWNKQISTLTMFHYKRFYCNILHISSIVFLEQACASRCTPVS